MILSYQGFDPTGKAVSGQVEASSIAEGREQLRLDNIFATSVEALGAASTTVPASEAAPSLRGRCKPGDVAQFFRQLCILSRSHTPVAQSLVVLEGQADLGGLGPVIADLRRRVEEGDSLSQAMRAHPGVFDSVSCSMVEAGEAAGSLDFMLDALSNLLRQQLVMKRAVIGAMMYPAILLGIGLIAMLIMVTFVLPQFQELFDTLQAPLPATTAILMSVGLTIRSFWFIVFPAVGAGVWAGWRALRRPSGRQFLDRTIIATPRIGPMACSIATARIARLLGAMLGARINLLEALKLARESTPSFVFAQILDEAEQNIGRGGSLSEAFTDSEYVPAAVAAAIASGERSGELAPVFDQIADYLDEDNQQVMKTVSGVLEPVILTLLGVAVGVLALSMFLPLFDLAGAAGGQP